MKKFFIVNVMEWLNCSSTLFHLTMTVRGTREQAERYLQRLAEAETARGNEVFAQFITEETVINLDFFD